MVWREWKEKFFSLSNNVEIRCHLMKPIGVRFRIDKRRYSFMQGIIKAAVLYMHP